MYYELRIEPKTTMSREEITKRIENAFADVGLSAEGVEIFNVDWGKENEWLYESSTTERRIWLI